MSIYNPSFLGELDLHDVGVDLKWEESNYTVVYQTKSFCVVKLNLFVGPIKSFCGVELNLFVALTSPGLRIPLGKAGWCRKSGKF